MKAILLLSLMAFLMICNKTTAQKPIVVADDSIRLATGMFPGISITIPEVNYERTQKNWIKELQSRTKSNVVSENGEMSIFGASVKDISDNPLNIYSRLISQDSLLILQACFELKKDLYVEKANGDLQLNAAKDFMKKFAKDQYVDFAKEELQVEDKKMKELENNLNSLQNEKSRMEKSIQSNGNSIKSEEENIALQKNEANKVEAEILRENEQLSTMEAGAAKDEKASYLKELEKRKKKINNEIESSQNKIKRANNDIDEANRKIPENLTQQESVKQKIAIYKPVVQKYTEKLNTIKSY